MSSLVAAAACAWSMSACGSADDGTADAAVVSTAAPATTDAQPTSPTDPAASTSPTPPGAAPVASDAELAAAALLRTDDLGGSFGPLPDTLDFPNDVALARSIPECAEFAELVFTNGADHGAGVSDAFITGTDILFTYVVVFPTVEAATAMLAAVSTPEFDRCWAAFNGVAVTKLPIDISSARYELVTPPELTVDADDYTVKSLEGTVTIGGDDVGDTCICVFARAGRGIVEVHSTAPTFTLEERSAAVQAAVDKLRLALASS